MNDFSIYSSTQMFLFFSAFSSLVIGYKHRKKYYPLKNFYLYPLSSLLQFATFYITTSFNLDITHETNIISASIYIFLLSEFILVYQFFLRLFVLPSLKKSFFFLRIGFGIIFILYWPLVNNNFLSPTEFYALEAIYILIPAFIYLNHFLKNPIIPDLTNEPSFWITIGLIFYFSCTLPIFLLKDFVFSVDGFIYESELFSINYICYGCLFLLITKAYLCKKPDLQ